MAAEVAGDASDHDQLQVRVHGEQVIGVRRDQAVVVLAGVQNDVHIDHVVVSGAPAQLSDRASGGLVEGLRVDFLGVEEPCQSSRTHSASPGLRDHSGDYMDLEPGPGCLVEAIEDAHVSTLCCDQGAGVQRQ